MNDFERQAVRDVTRVNPCCQCCARWMKCVECGEEYSGYETSPFDSTLCINCCPTLGDWVRLEGAEAYRELDAWRLQLSLDRHNDRRAAIMATRAKRDAS